jgi:hypothetical protein
VLVLRGFVAERALVTVSDTGAFAAFGAALATGFFFATTFFAGFLAILTFSE